MAKRAKKGGSRGARKAGFVEWVGGVLEVPGYVTGEGEPYRPEALIFLGADGMILGSALGRPGELLGLACGCLREAIEQPLIGRPHAPDRIRVADEGLADALRAGRADIEVVCAPTPEFDELEPAMREMMAADEPRGSEDMSYLGPGMEPEAMAAMFRAAAALHRAGPWEVVPSDQDLFSITCPEFGLDGAALSVIGQMGESFGFILFDDIDGFMTYVEAAFAVQRGEEPALPRQFVLNYERGADLPPGLQKEVTRHGWEVAAAEAYPTVMAVDEDLVARPASAREVVLAEALALSLTEVLGEAEALRAAWDGGEPVERVVRVETSGGPVELTLRAPHPQQVMPGELPDDLIGALAEIAALGDLVEPEARLVLEEALVERFAASPEARGLDGVGVCRYLFEFGAGYLGETIATLGPEGLEEIVFDLIPRKVVIQPSEAGIVIAECRAFYAFLQREFDLEQAGACLAVLDDQATAALEAALGDHRNFGPAKAASKKKKDRSKQKAKPKATRKARKKK